MKCKYYEEVQLYLVDDGVEQERGGHRAYPFVYFTLYWQLWKEGKNRDGTGQTVEA